MVLGPHYDNVNPLLPSEDLGQIDGVVRYSDANWQDASHTCQVANMPIGNSSAANIAVSRYLASKGRTVFTFIYEPLRQFYTVPEVDGSDPSVTARLAVTAGTAS
jgi:hypothetical protein